MSEEGEMASVQGTIAQPEPRRARRSSASPAQQGYALSPGECGDGWIVFNKSMTAFSCAPAPRALPADRAGETRLTVSTGETFAVTDWGRGKRAARRLLEPRGAGRLADLRPPA